MGNWIQLLFEGVVLSFDLQILDLRPIVEQVSHTTGRLP